MTKSAEIDAAKLWLVLSKAHRAMKALAEQSIVGTGLGFTDFMVLEALLHKGPMTITEIQSRVLLASGSMTAAIDRLEKNALVTRNFTAADRRARVIELTGEGRRVIQTSFKQHLRDLESATTPLNEEERRQLYLLIKKLGLRAEEVRDKGEKKKLVESL
ncbi:MAG TPA: MarR family transcriptional regulator [Terriglobales bacterium]|nr:MarR family transcriptional regulator [Terriglobales bacterium]